ncbi:CoA-transferase [Cupriavidus sp. 2TAF22]|uniref:CoA-transferase n=1 Tax=unclassified Cupriavidus TaxID=2640874 RepID=UPI003F9287D6
MSWTVDEMAERAARELRDGEFVELGPGLPALVANHIDVAKEVWVHSDDRLPGMGLYPTDDYMDADILDAGRGGKRVGRQLTPFHSTQSFAAMLSPTADVAILEALCASSAGEFIEPENTIARRKTGGALGNATYGAGRIILLVRESGLVHGCGGPSHIVDALGGHGMVERAANRIITEWAVLDVTSGGLRLVEAASGVTRGEIQAKIGSRLLD